MKMYQLLYFLESIEDITEGSMLGPIEGLIESSSLGIS